MDALVAGTVVFDDAGQCLYLQSGELRYPIVWPAGASWHPPNIEIGGHTVEPGMTISGGGGFVGRAQVENLAGPDVAAAAVACAGENDEIAFFNAGAELSIGDG